MCFCDSVCVLSLKKKLAIGYCAFCIAAGISLDLLSIIFDCIYMSNFYILSETNPYYYVYDNISDSRIRGIIKFFSP